jgi:hypothetical protein
MVPLSANAVPAMASDATAEIRHDVMRRFILDPSGHEYGEQ